MTIKVSTQGIYFMLNLRGVRPKLVHNPPAAKLQMAEHAQVSGKSNLFLTILSSNTYACSVV